jgi:hypothetical protein
MRVVVSCMAEKVSLQRRAESEPTTHRHLVSDRSSVIGENDGLTVR